MATEDESEPTIAPEETMGKGQLPAIDFSTFVLSLSTTALHQMGLVTEPGSGKTIEPDGLLARQTIDTLEMLREKTRGNLDPEETMLFENLLYELRLRFVELGE